MYNLRGVNFLQRQASYCGNLGMTHKDEKCQNQCSTVYMCMRVNTPIFGLKCPYRCVQCPDGRVLGWSGLKTAQKHLLEGSKVSQKKKLGGWDTSPPPQNHQKLPKIVYFGQNLGVLRGGKEHPTTPKKYLEYFWPFQKTFLGGFPT